MVAAPARWQHGYELMQATGIKSGTLYPLLIRLADDGLLETEWQEPVAPVRIPRHGYRLTLRGRAFALDLLDVGPAPQFPKGDLA